MAIRKKKPVAAPAPTGCPLCSFGQYKNCPACSKTLDASPDVHTTHAHEGYDKAKGSK